jgi:hypothetical protein
MRETEWRPRRRLDELVVGQGDTMERAAQRIDRLCPPGRRLDGAACADSL